MAEKPPARLMISDLRELLRWYETNLCAANLRDPRGHRVKFDAARFPYLIKLRSEGGRKLRKPLKKVEKIRCNLLTNQDFGGFDPERAQTLPWLAPLILRPTLIIPNTHLLVPGDEVYIKEFEKSGYRYKVLVCTRFGPRLLVPMTSFPRERVSVLKGTILWPKN